MFTNLAGGSLQYPFYTVDLERVIESGSGHGSGKGVHTTTIYLIKTGPIPSSAQIQAALFPTFQYSYGITEPAPFEENFLTVNFSGVINVVSRSCQVDDVDVDLGSHQLTSFTGIGTVTNWKDFNITLRNCPPFHGYYATRDSLVYSETSGVVTNNAPTSNRIDMAFRGANGYRSSNMAYLNAGSDQAKGIGLQMTDASENLILFNGTTYDPALALTKVDGASYVIPLKARYYQYSSTVTAGKANASVTFTINYY